MGASHMSYRYIFNILIVILVIINTFMIPPMERIPNENIEIYFHSEEIEKSKHEEIKRQSNTTIEVSCDLPTEFNLEHDGYSIEATGIIYCNISDVYCNVELYLIATSNQTDHGEVEEFVAPPILMVDGRGNIEENVYLTLELSHLLENNTVIKWKFGGTYTPSSGSTKNIEEKSGTIKIISEFEGWDDVYGDGWDDDTTGDDDNETSNASPGFELFYAVLAIGLCIGIIGWRRRRK